ncbi:MULTISPECIES: hypothetical protein [Pantoea]|uniref:hypothetical protein n=1 Tax=Pantoea TaxID=53335 RepID=UPI000614F070|nr:MULTISPECIES: hypothetical protein [Pantoea]KAF6662791.1 hypothetical protein HFD91_04290 [Enterobacteriaceae bacterium EKM102V]KAA5969463.1 hypothetical protein F3I51_16370 [Pantoea sp. M_6]KAA5975683.1 hypothetical protein F3I52_14500 [Pantoea sp. M_8]KAA5993899.1 hypothetical protein F3I47_02505 [Pantoea sp. M_10]KAF6669256.1 hypothetical protein HFD92_03305 [Pantoea sp. EKM101V]
MSTNKPVDMDEVHAVVGHAVASLLKSGQPAGAEEILAFLRQQEARSVNGQRDIYTHALRVVMAIVR